MATGPPRLLEIEPESIDSEITGPGGDGLVVPSVHDNTNYDNWTDELERIRVSMLEKEQKSEQFGKSDQPQTPVGIDINQMVADELNPTAYLLHPEKPVFGETAFGWMKSDHWLRLKAMRIEESAWFNTVTLVIIVINAVFLGAAEDPRRPSGTVAYWLVYSGYALFTVLFWIEMTIHVLAMGFRNFSRSGWRLLDFVLNIFGLMCFVPSVYKIEWMRIIRILSAIRVFRSIRGLKALGDAIIYSVPSLLNVLILIIFLFFVYGLVGMQTWLDQHCSSDYANATNPNSGYTGFDNIFMTLLTLFALSSTDSWSTVMYYAQDIDGFSVWVYFVTFILLTTFFAANLVIAIVILRYQEFSAKEREGGSEGDLDPEGLLKKGIGLLVELNFKPLEQALGPAMEERLGAVRSFFRKLTKHVWFDRVIALVIVSNAILMSIDHYRAPVELTRAVGISEIVFTSIYSVEVILKIVGAGPRKYFGRPWNIFDFFVVISGIIELITSYTIASKPLNFLSVLRILRLFNLVTLWYGLERVLRTVIELRAYVYLSLLVLFFNFVVALIGRQLFSGGFAAFPTKPRWNFDDLWWSYLTTWQIMNGDTWTSAMYDGMRITPFAAIFFVLTYGLGANVLLKLFTGILVDKFSQIPEKVEKDARTGKHQVVEQLPENELFNRHNDDEDDQATHALLQSVATDLSLSPKKKKKANRQDTGGGIILDEHEDSDEDEEDETQESVEKEPATSSVPNPAPSTSTRREKREVFDKIKRIVIKGTSVNVEMAKPPKIPTGPPPPPASPLALTFLQWCVKIATDAATDWAMFVVVIANCVILAIDNPGLRTHAIIDGLMTAAEALFLFLYIADVLVKAIAFGLLFGKEAFLRPKRLWNIIDLLVIVVSAGALVWSQVGPLRAFRAIRILRGVSRFEGTKVATRSIIRTIPTAVNVGLVLSMFWLIFAILGVSLFQGVLHKCSDPLVLNETLCIGTFVDGTGLLSDRQWINPPFHFDNVGAAMLSLFQVAAGVGGVDVMYAVIDGTADGQAPQRDAHPERALFFIVFTVVGKLFALNLLTGAVIDNYNRMKMRLKGSAFLSDKQKQWLHAQKIFLKLKPERPLKAPENKRRRMFFNVVTSTQFLWAMNVVILINILFLSLRYFGAPASLHRAVSISNYVFLGVYSFEALLKILALGPSQYFGENGKMSWTLFEFGVIVATITVMSAGFDVESPLVRLLRTLPLLRLIKGAARLNVVFGTFLYSLPSIWNIAILLFVVYYAFAIFGMNVFGHLLSVSKSGINDQVNFSSFGLAMLTLFRLSTLDSWPWIMFDSQKSPVGCEVTESCGDYWNWTYFVTFIIVQVYILLNLLLAVLMDTYNEFSHVDMYSKWSHFKNFTKLWQDRDPHSTGKIPADRVLDLLQSLGYPLGFQKGMSKLQILKELRAMDIRLTAKMKVYYEHLLRAITTRSIVVDLADVDIEEFKAQKLTPFTIGHWYAASLIQKHWRQESAAIKLHNATKYNELMATAKGKEEMMKKTVEILTHQDEVERSLIAATNNAAMAVIRAANEMTDYDTADEIADQPGRDAEKASAAAKKITPATASSSSMTSTMTGLDLMDCLNDEDIKQMLTNYINDAEPTKKNLEFIDQLLQLKQVAARQEDPMQVMEGATTLFEQFFADGAPDAKALDIPNAERLRIKKHIEKQLHQTTTPQHLFRQANQLVLQHIQQNLLPGFFASPQFSEYARLIVKDFVVEVDRNGDLVLQLVQAELEKEALQRKVDALKPKEPQAPVAIGTLVDFAEEDSDDSIILPAKKAASPSHESEPIL